MAPSRQVTGAGEGIVRGPQVHGGVPTRAHGRTRAPRPAPGSVLRHRRGPVRGVAVTVALALLLAACSAAPPVPAPPPGAPTSAPPGRPTSQPLVASGRPAPAGTPSSGQVAGSPEGPSSAGPLRSPATDRGRPAAPGRGGAGFTIAATGDMLPHDDVLARARANAARRGLPYDFRPLLARVRPALAAADLALCHLESPLSLNGRGVTGYPVFTAPPELAVAAVWAGYDGCSTASNHSLDRGAAGVRATLTVLDRAGLRHTGMASTPGAAIRPAVYRVKGVRVAHLSYTAQTNGSRDPRALGVNVLDVPRVLADARAARAAGARFVVVSLHWGQEYRSAPTARQRAQARALLRSPAVDLIIGGHAHVQQPVEKVGDKYVVYGTGNLFSNQSPARGLPPQTQDGMVVTAHVVPRGGRFVVDRVTRTYTYCHIGSFVVWPVTRSLADRTLPAGFRAALRASLARSRAVHARSAA